MNEHRMSYPLSDDELGGITGGSSSLNIGNSMKYYVGQNVRVRDRSVSGGEWTGKIMEQPNYTTVNGKTTWYCDVYIASPPAPYKNVPTIMENIPLSSIIGTA